jgi:hypothetical protein
VKYKNFFGTVGKKLFRFFRHAPVYRDQIAHGSIAWHGYDYQALG